MEHIAAHIRNIPDFPEPGIQFKDITPLLKNAQALQDTVKALAEPYRTKNIDVIAGMESRGFIFGSLVAAELDVGFIPLRKPGKLPYRTESVSYDLEYGSAELHMHIDAVESSHQVLLVDDLIATGGTAAASCELVEKLGAQVAGCAFVIELDFLNGRDLLKEYDVHSLLHY